MRKLVGFRNLSTNTETVNYYLSGTFISSIGDGMFYLAISKLAFDLTKSMSVIGIVLIIQSMTSFGANFLAGYFVDIHSPKRISILSDNLQGLVVLLGTFILLFSNIGIFSLYALMFVVSFVNPFFRAANFKILPQIDKESLELIKLNGLRSSVKQGGLLLGATIVAPLVSFHATPFALILDSLTFFISAFCTFKIKLNDNYKETTIKKEKKKNNWIQFLKLLLNNRILLILILFSIFDYWTLNFFNLIEIKYATDILHNAIFISLLDGSYAIGAMLSFLLINHFYAKLEFRQIAWIGLFIEAIIIVFLAFIHQIIFVTFSLIVMGIFTGASISVFQSKFHRDTNASYQGKISSIRDTLISASTLLIVPIFVGSLNKKFIVGMSYFGGTILIVSLLLALLCIMRYFDGLLKE